MKGMKIKNRIAALCAGCLALCGAAETEGDFEYPVNDDGESVTVTGYTGSPKRGAGSCIP